MATRFTHQPGVLVGGAAPLPTRALVGVRREKGYAASRRRYDERRRRNERSSVTLLFQRILRCDPCFACLEAGRIDVDHITPLNAGGRDHWGNMTAACPGCNRGRRDTPILFFLLRRAVT